MTQQTKSTPLHLREEQPGVAGLKDRLMAYFAEKDIVFPVFDEMQEETKVYHPDIEDSP